MTASEGTDLVVPLHLVSPAAEAALCSGMGLEATGINSAGDVVESIFETQLLMPLGLVWSPYSPARCAGSAPHG